MKEGKDSLLSKYTQVVEKSGEQTLQLARSGHFACATSRIAFSSVCESMQLAAKFQQ